MHLEVFKFPNDAHRYPNDVHFFLFSSFFFAKLSPFLDSAFQTKKYSHLEVSHLDLRNNPQAEVQAHMKLFRAQRNLYITGFSLFMLL